MTTVTPIHMQRMSTASAMLPIWNDYLHVCCAYKTCEFYQKPVLPIPFFPQSLFIRQFQWQLWPNFDCEKTWSWPSDVSNVKHECIMTYNTIVNIHIQLFTTNYNCKCLSNPRIHRLTFKTGTSNNCSYVYGSIVRRFLSSLGKKKFPKKKRPKKNFPGSCLWRV